MKVAIVYSFNPSDWFSCTVINKNLRHAYEFALGAENILYVDYTRDRKVEKKDLDAIVEQGIKKIIFIDHQPTPVDFLLKFKKLHESYLKEIEYTIHVFGDFPLYLREWRTVFEILDGLKLKFIAASKKQVNFVNNFLNQKNIVEQCPFPVNKQEFNFNTEVRKEARLKLGFQDEDQVFIFTGRLTFQKRIREMVEVFLDLLKTNRLPNTAKLLLVGSVDQQGIPYLGFHQLLGEYYRDLEKVLDRFPKQRKNIIMSGRVRNDELKGYYNAADAFLSLSTYHDEDYGMSIAEALCCGLPCILTDWAGYSSFQLSEKPEYCQLVKTHLSKVIPEIELEVFEKKIQEFQRDQYNRSSIQDLYHEHFSIEYASQLLAGIQETEFLKFEGTTDFTKRVTNEQFLRGNEFLRQESHREYNSLYFEAYKYYAE